MKYLCFYLFSLIIYGSQTNAVYRKNGAQIKFSSSLRAPVCLGAPAHLMSGEHISLKFYEAIETSEQAKNRLQNLLQDFLENLQRNLSSSAILNSEGNTMDSDGMKHQREKLNDLSDFFEYSSMVSNEFANKAELFFEWSKNESLALLLKLRQLPPSQRFLPNTVKMRLTDYFTEMEFFQFILCDIIDQALEYIVDTLHSIQNTFLRYADIQREVLRTSDFNMDQWCCNGYMDFLQKWSAQVYKCAAGTDLQVAYDVFAITEITSKYLMQQLEFRVQRLYNCFIFGGYEFKCRFLNHPEQDFEKLFAKLEELQQYFDIKIKRGRVLHYRFYRLRRSSDNGAVSDDVPEANDDDDLHFGDDLNNGDSMENIQNRCIPRGFPAEQMSSSLKTCFNFTASNDLM